MVKHSLFALLVRGITLLVVGMTLASCDIATQINEDPYFRGTVEGDPAAVKAFQKKLREPSFYSDVIYYSTFKEDALYLPDDYVEQITKDRNSLLTKLIGPALWRNNTTYADVAKYNIQGLDEATFNYVKGAGRAWIMSLRDDPKNAYIKERYELYKTRLGGNDLTAESEINSISLRNLLRDDDALSQFLTDDDYAGEWLSRNPVLSFSGAAKKKYPDNFIPNLGPATSAVLPNASP